MCVRERESVCVCRQIHIHVHTNSPKVTPAGETEGVIMTTRVLTEVQR